MKAAMSTCLHVYLETDIIGHKLCSMSGVLNEIDCISWQIMFLHRHGKMQQQKRREI